MPSAAPIQVPAGTADEVGMGEHHDLPTGFMSDQILDLPVDPTADSGTTMTPSGGAGMGESSEMITLTQAFASRFPAGSSWARQALAGIGVDFSDDVLVHDICAGWLRLDDAAPLVDTLWVLTDDKLGIGQTNAGAGDPRWIPLTAVVAIDAIDDSPLPLLAVEMHLAGGMVMCAGWPEPFAEHLVALLVDRSTSTPTTSGSESTDTMPRELADPTVSAAVLGTSSLEDLDPSAWVEGSVGITDVADAPATRVPATDTPIGTPGPTDPPASGLPPAGWYTPSESDEGVSFAPSGDLDAGAISGGWVNPFDVMDPAIANADFGSGFSTDSHDPAVTAGFGARPSNTDAATFDAPASAEPIPDGPGLDPSEAVLDDFFGELDHAPITESVPLAQGGNPDGATVVELDPHASDAPWNNRSVQWPAPVSGVTYVGGHPEQTRKRKNGTITFAPGGVRVAGSGLQSWDLDLPWTHVTKVRAEGTDEVMFTEGVRIEPSSSALIVELIDGAKVYFEVRMRRPGSLRSPLAPVLQLAADIRSYRATGHP